jgi:adenylate kinase family enzyme
MQRVMIVGGPGSGKSTLARALGAATGLPIFHMDHIHWLPGWIQRPRPEHLALVRAVEACEDWIFEGGFPATYEDRMVRADTLIWLDMPVGLRLWRVVWRQWRNRGQRRPDMAEGCVEGWHSETLPFFAYIWRTRDSGRVRIARLIQARRPGLRVVHLRSRAEVAAFMSQKARACARTGKRR